MIRLVCSYSSLYCSTSSSYSRFLTSYKDLQSVIRNYYQTHQVDSTLELRSCNVSQTQRYNNMNEKKTGERIVDECVRILKEESNEGTQKWLKESHITSLNLRNVKALEIINLSNYMIQKMIIGQLGKPHQLLSLLCDYHKKNSLKCHEYSRLVKNFSQWDYEFEYIYRVALDLKLNQLGLYMRVREGVVRGEFNKAKKELMSGITAELEQWAALTKIIFKDRDEEDVIEQFTKVVKNHYLQVKKSQSDKINGAEFLRICQIIDDADPSIAPPLQASTSPQVNQVKQTDPMTGIFEQTVLSGLTTQDKQLIRVLSYRDKNIARMLEQKHTKMVNLIGEQVNTLRKDINREKQRYMQVIEQKNVLHSFIQKLKESTLRYILNRNQATQLEVLQQLENYNKKYRLKNNDVVKTIDTINNRRLIEIIEREELQPDQ